MNSNVWAKTTLFSYPYLVKLADSIDRMIERKALYSFPPPSCCRAGHMGLQSDII